MDDNTISLTIT